MSRSATKEDLIEIMQGISEKVPTGGGGISSWQPETEYVEGQVILHDKFLYKVIEDFISGTEFDDSNLEMIGGGEGLKEWQAEKEYEEGNILVYEGQIYKALVKFISGTTFDKTEILEEYILAGGETPILWAKGTEITTNDIVEYDGNYYKALVNFTCGEEFTVVALKEYVPQPLTEEQIEEVIEAYEPEFSGSSGGVNYSTEETCIGTWIDGKPLYQKTVQFTLPSSSGERTYSFLPDIPFADMDTLVGRDGFCNAKNGWLVAYGYVVGTQTAFGVDWHKTSQRIWFYVDRTDIASQPATLTFQYTKTTD